MNTAWTLDGVTKGKNALLRLIIIDYVCCIYKTNVSEKYQITLYRDDVLSLNNSRFGDYLHRIYPNELEAKDNGRKNKNKTTTSAKLSLFQQSTFLSPVAIFQHHQGMELHFTTNTLFWSLCPVHRFSGQSSTTDAKATQTRLLCSQVEIIATKILRWS